MLGKDLLLNVAGVGKRSPERAQMDDRTCGFEAKSADGEFGVPRLFLGEIQGDAKDAMG